jgi:hypothetical protein
VTLRHDLTFLINKPSVFSAKLAHTRRKKHSRRQLDNSFGIAWARGLLRALSFRKLRAC